MTNQMEVNSVLYSLRIGFNLTSTILEFEINSGKARAKILNYLTQQYFSKKSLMYSLWEVNDHIQ